MLQTVTESQPGEKTYAVPTYLNQPAPPLPSTTPHFTLQMQMIPEVEVEAEREKRRQQQAAVQIAM